MTKPSPATVGARLAAWSIARAITQLTRAYLGVKGAFYVGIGLTWVLIPSGNRVAGVDWLGFITPQAVGWAWIAAGSIAVLSAHFLEERRSARPGWVALIAPPTLFGLWFLVAWIQWLTTGHGAERGVATTVSYFAFSASAFLFSQVSVLAHRIVAPLEGKPLEES